jgi:predicted RNase H-like nuclease (RuvC/YqgF family)
VVDAIHSVESDSGYSPAISRYLNDFARSRIFEVTRALRDKLKSKSSRSPLLALRIKIAHYHVQDALSAGLASIREMRHHLNQAFVDASNLRMKIEESQARVEGDVFGDTLMTDVDQVAEAIRLAEAEMRMVMDRLTWWRMISRVDEISSIVGDAVTRTWCIALEKKVGTGLFFTNIAIHKHAILKSSLFYILVAYQHYSKA